MIKRGIFAVVLFFHVPVAIWQQSCPGPTDQAQRRLQRDQRRPDAGLGCGTGIFEKNGLDVQLIYFTGGTTAVMALISADTPISQVAGAAVVNSVLAGSDAVIIVGGLTSLNYYLMGRPDIKTPEQLKGGSVAISRFGSSSDFIARYALSKVGVTPESAPIVQIGSTPARMDATLTGRVQATVINKQASIIAQKRGMSILADLPQARACLPAHHGGDHQEIRARIPGHRSTLCKVSGGGGPSHIYGQGNLVESIDEILWPRHGTGRFGEDLGKSFERPGSVQEAVSFPRRHKNNPRLRAQSKDGAARRVHHSRDSSGNWIRAASSTGCTRRNELAAISHQEFKTNE